MFLMFVIILKVNIETMKTYFNIIKLDLLFHYTGMSIAFYKKVGFENCRKIYNQ